MDSFSIAQDGNTDNKKENKIDTKPQTQAAAPLNQPSKTTQPAPSTQPTLKIISIGGTETVTKNLTVYEYADDIIVVDCGIGIPDSDMLGVNAVIPDFTYLLENQHKIRGILITHGHEDHLGAVPYLLEQMDVPIYANNLVQGFLLEKLKDKNFKGLDQRVSLHFINHESGPVTLGVFKIEAFHLNHSVPASMGFAITTPEGLILHMADYKIDWTPVLDPPIQLGRIAQYGDKGVLCLLSDCLNVTSEGYSKSEQTLNETFFDLFTEAGNRQVMVTTISSNISRMYQVVKSAQRVSRKIVLLGRSIDQSVSVARRLGYLPFADDMFVSEMDAPKYPQGELVYIIAGCYGQQGSALDRVSRAEHEQITLEQNAMVVFSADPNPPGVAADVERLMSNLTLAGAEVIYSKIQENLHVSGHGTQGDLLTVAALVKPKFFIPIGGTITKMRAYSKMLGTLGVKKDQVFELQAGEVLAFSQGKASVVDKIEVRDVYIGNRGNEEINPMVLKDRGQLSTDGVFVVIVPTGKDGAILIDKIEVVTRGLVYVKESQEFLEKSRKYTRKVLNKYLERKQDPASLRKKVEYEVAGFLKKEMRKSPMVIVQTISV